MRKALIVLAAASIVVASIAGAAPDPWRVKVNDLDPLQPVRAATGLCSDEPQPYWIGPDTGNWGASGGQFEMWWMDTGNALGNGAYELYHSVNNFNATTGAISWGTDASVSITGTGTAGGWGKLHTISILKVGSVYKLFAFESKWVGQDRIYASGATPTLFSAPLTVTTYGSTDMNTAGYGFQAYRSANGTYVELHKNSMAYYGTWMAGMGLSTTGVGETVWYDIDTGNTPGAGNSCGDPLRSPDPAPTDTTPDVYPAGKAGVGRVCDGNLMFMYNTSLGPNAPWITQTSGVVVGTAGELAGGDHYTYVCDPDSGTTIAGILNTPLGNLNVLGLSGPNLRVAPPDWGNTIHLPLGLNANVSDPSTKFLVLYEACWDTDSDGTRDDQGWGRAIMSMSRNKADLNMDGTVNFQDIGPFSGAYGSSIGQPAYNPDADFNGDGKVDFLDIGPLSGRYGTDCSYDDGT